jgi:hypothetical protein
VPDENTYYSTVPAENQTVTVSSEYNTTLDFVDHYYKPDETEPVYSEIRK